MIKKKKLLLKKIIIIIIVITGIIMNQLRAFTKIKFKLLMKTIDDILNQNQEQSDLYYAEVLMIFGIQ